MNVLGLVITTNVLARAGEVNRVASVHLRLLSLLTSEPRALLPPGTSEVDVSVDEGGGGLISLMRFPLSGKSRMTLAQVWRHPVTRCSGARLICR